jgi:dihydroneopterin triphosphate diphosphatase
MIPIRSKIVSGVAISKMDGTDKILLLKRNHGGFWCHVAGSIENRETAYQAIVREFQEETQIQARELYSAEFFEQFYVASENLIELIPVFIVICPPNQKVTLNNEHSDFKWCSVGEAKELVPYPGQRRVYDQVWNLFSDGHLNDYLKIDLKS